MYISLEMSRTSGFRKWADVHQPIGNEPAETTPPSSPSQDPAHAMPTPSVRPDYQPWLIPGVGTTF
jgi:hypothetical protein